MSQAREEVGSRRVGVLAVVVTSILWGTTGTAATFAPEAGPLAIAAVSLGVGGLLQGVVAAGQVRRARGDLWHRWTLVAAGAGSVAVYPLAFYTSMHLAGVAVGTVISLGLAPVAAGVIERVVEGRRCAPAWLAAAGCGALGCAGLAVGRAGGHGAPAVAVAGLVPGTMAATAVGVALGLVAAVTYATYSWVAGRLMRAGVSRAGAMGAVFGCGGVLLMPVLALTGGPLLATPRTAAVALYMALVPMFLGYLLFGVGLSRLPASTVTVLTLIEPAVAALLAVVVVGERLAWLGWCGIALVGASLVVLSWPRRGGAGADGDGAH